MQSWMASQCWGQGCWRNLTLASTFWNPEQFGCPLNAELLSFRIHPESSRAMPQLWLTSLIKEAPRALSAIHILGLKYCQAALLSHQCLDLRGMGLLSWGLSSPSSHSTIQDGLDRLLSKPIVWRIECLSSLPGHIQPDLEVLYGLFILRHLFPRFARLLPGLPFTFVTFYQVDIQAYSDTSCGHKVLQAALSLSLWAFLNCIAVMCACWLCWYVDLQIVWWVL